jgi:tetratricopeptide (TPR) repeat protein
MSHLHRIAALLLATAVTGELRAQIVSTLPPPARSGTTATAGFHGSDHHGGKLRISLFLSNSFTNSYYAPYPYFPAFGNAVTVIAIAAPPPQPVVVVGPPTPAEMELLRDLHLAPREPVDQPADAPAPGIRRIGPNNRAPFLMQLPPPPPPAPEPPLKVNAPAIPLPNPERPEDNPKDEYARLVKLGKEAFAAQQYGRAAKRFRGALAVDDQAMAHFLLAQAEFALGKYFEAVDAIHAGLKLDPNWPASSFQPQTLYAPDGDEFTEQLQRLQNALSRHPDDPVLLFLYAYQLWFDGRRNEALPLFQRAAAVAPDKALINRFLQAKP